MKKGGRVARRSAPCRVEAQFAVIFITDPMPLTFIKRLATITLLCACVACSSGELKTFTTDGCSAFPDGTLKQQSLWLNCCISHDLAYWKGGTYDERLSADLGLEQCVASIGEPEVAKLMLAGVRVGGSPYYPTTYRWGYGWPYPRGYKALSKTEKQQVKDRLTMLELMMNSLLDEIQSDETH
jgi:hypothetical protein